MPDRNCVVPECERPHHGRGVCRSHYMQCWRGELAWPVYERPIPVALSDRFWAKVARAGQDECWLWTASVLPNGYGQFDHTTAHRMSYTLTHGTIPKGLQIDHLCRRLLCVNPSHLEAVTPSENVRRGYGPPIVVAAAVEAGAARTHCIHGHELTPENTYNPPGAPRWRVCRTCKRRIDLERKRVRREQRTSEVRPGLR